MSSGAKSAERDEERVVRNEMLGCAAGGGESAEGDAAYRHDR
jgi:hypothetical protein